MFLEVLCCCLCIWGSSHFPQSLLTDFRRQIPFTSPAGILRLLRRSVDTPAPRSLLPLWQNSKHVCLLSILQHIRPGADSLLCFPKARLELKSVVPPCLQTWAGFLHVLTSYLPKLALTVRGAPREPATWCGRGTWSAGARRGTCRRGLPSGSWVGFLMESSTLSVGSTSLQCPLRVLFTASPAFSIPSHVAHDSVLWMGWGKDEPLWQCPTWLGKPGTYSHALIFPCGRNHLALSCASLAGGWHG